MAAAYSSYMVDHYMWGFESFLFPVSKALQPVAFVLRIFYCMSVLRDYVLYFG